jgi:hypothetical protein
VKTIPTVVSGAGHVIALLAFEGRHRIPNRDAVGFYYTIKVQPDARDSRVSVVFSGTVQFVDTSAFDLPEIADKTERFRIYAEAAIGDYLCDRGRPDFTPSGVSAFQIECFSPHFQEWADRTPASDAAIEAYLHDHVFASWTFAQDDWEIGLSDCLRLHRPLAFIERLVRLGEGKDWHVVNQTAHSLRLRGSSDFLRQRRAESPRSTQPQKEAQPVAPRSKDGESADVTPAPAGYVFVDEVRIAELKATTAARFDPRKIIALCEELNICYRSQCYYAVAALTRALLDHVPPVFGCSAFAEVANNYDGGRSFKDCMQHLENAARRIGDMHLHTRVRAKESLPTRTQVNFAPEVDTLLAEVVRVLGP